MKKEPKNEERRVDLLWDNLQSREKQEKKNWSLSVDQITYNFLVSLSSLLYLNLLQLLLYYLSASNSPFRTCSAIVDWTLNVSPFRCMLNLSVEDAGKALREEEGFAFRMLHSILYFIFTPAVCSVSGECVGTSLILCPSCAPQSIQSLSHLVALASWWPFHMALPPGKPCPRLCALATASAHLCTWTDCIPGFFPADTMAPVLQWKLCPYASAYTGLPSLASYHLNFCLPSHTN